MQQQDRYIPGVPCWIDTAQPDPQAAAAFYGELFGWSFEDRTPPDAPMSYAIARRPGGDVAGVASAEAGTTATWTTYVWVEDAEAAAARVRAAGGTVHMGPDAAGEAGRMAVCADPEGAAFCLWEAARHRGADVVNEHGSLNFNTLATRDPQAAEAFYGAVFGWELLPVGDGLMWALPGYGDFLEARTPGMRENMAAMGAPERFEDVVAAVLPIAPGQDDVAPHWEVTFGVDDADAIAARVPALGGTVLLPPTDLPWVRMTVVRDPQGATFTASQFVPENRELEQTAGTAA